MSRSTSLPPPRPDWLDLSHLSFKPPDPSVWDRFIDSFCPVCKIFVPKDEIHVASGRDMRCHKIINVTFD